MMKPILLASAGVFAAMTMIAAANAADLRRPIVPKAPVAVPPPLYNWTGLYIGINGGGALGRGHINAPLGSSRFDVSGPLVGGTIGYNIQTGPWVWGLEGDIDWTDIHGTTSSVTCPGCGINNSWLATVRGRVGYAFNNVLPYVTGGLAVGDVNVSVPGFSGATDTQAGYAVGGGLEFALGGKWTAKGEYLYVDLGRSSCGVTACGGATSGDFSAHVFRAGLNYRF